jgi:hypothetical protein
VYHPLKKSTMPEGTPPPRKKRVAIPIGTKIDVANAWIWIALAGGMSLSAFARLNAVQPVQVRRWVKKLAELKEWANELGRTKGTVHKGPASSLEHIKEDMLQWLFEVT